MPFAVSQSARFTPAVKKYIATFVMLLWVLFGALPLATYAQQGDATGAEKSLVVPGEVIVTFKKNPTRSGRTLALTGGYTLNTTGLKSLTPISANTFRVRATGAVVQQARSVIARARFGPLTTERALCDELVKSDSVATCSPNWAIHVAPSTNSGAQSPGVAAVPNDPNFGLQYAHTRIDSDSAWRIATNSETVVVGVVDTGVDYNHPDLRDNIWTNVGEIPGNGIDDDGNGYIDDVYGWDSSHSVDGKPDDGDPMDGNGHGTHVAGIIGATGNNAQGVVGVSWRAKIMPIKFLSDDGWGAVSDAIEGIDYALTMKKRGVNLRVLSNSWGGAGYVPELEAAINRARSAGIIFVAAAGNFATNNDFFSTYPASIALDNVVSVAASTNTDSLALFSCFGGSTVHIAAPGVDILSTWPGASYQNLSGTSMAAPYVSGALALLLASQPQLDYRQAIERLLSTAKPILQLEGLTTTGRLLNVGNLLENKNPPALVDPYLCEYTASLIPYTPPADFTDSARIIPRPGEWYQDNATVQLPFPFPFYSSSFTSLQVSINGILSFGEAPAPSATWRAPFPPILSIAPFYSFFFEWKPSEGTGVWLRTSPLRADIQWRTVWPVNPRLGQMTLTVSLFPDGTITQFFAMNDDVARMVQPYSLVGIRGNTLANSVTVSQNGFPVVFRGNMGLEYRPPPQCGINTTPPVPVATPTAAPTVVPTRAPTPTPGAPDYSSCKNYDPSMIATKDLRGGLETLRKLLGQKSSRRPAQLRARQKLILAQLAVIGQTLRRFYILELPLKTMAGEAAIRKSHTTVQKAVTSFVKKGQPVRGIVGAQRAVRELRSKFDSAADDWTCVR